MLTLKADQLLLVILGLVSCARLLDHVILTAASHYYGFTADDGWRGMSVGTSIIRVADH